jgi:hypothetical protein
MEWIATKTKNPLTDSGHNTGNGAGIDLIDFVLPPGLASWSIHVVPIDAATPAVVAPTVEVLYGIGSSFYTTNPTGGAVATVINQDNVITRTDQISKVRLKITNGAVVPSGGVRAELYGSRTAPG